MYTLLKEYKKEKTMVALYTDHCQLDLFHVAYIIGINDEKILECNVDPHGNFDGYSAEYIDDIYRLEIASEYIKKIEYLSTFTDNKQNFTYTDEDPFEFLINLSIANNYAVTIYLKSSDNAITGYISNYGSNKVCVDMLSEYGKSDGKTTFYYNDIIKIVANDIDLHHLSILNKLIKE